MAAKPRYVSLRFHKQTKTYFTWDRLAKRRVYLGRDLDRARDRFAELAEAVDPEPPAGTTDLTVNGLLARYVRFRQADGADVRSLGRTKAAARFARPFGSRPAAAFKALALRDVRNRMLAARSRRNRANPAAAQPLSRRYVNHLVNELRAAWQWAASMELVPGETASSLATLKSLRMGKGGRETVDVDAVEVADVEATLPELSPIVAAMVRLQLLAGCRPGELCALRPRDVSTDPEDLVPLPGTRRKIGALRCGKTLIWLAVPGSHKTLHRGKPRAIVLGPRAQEILKPFLDRDPDRPLFSPREASDRWRQEHDRRAVYAESRKPGERYTTSSYGQAIEAAIDRANRKRAESDLPALPHWRPNQLRHTAGSEVAEQFDRPTAQAFLGHAGIDVIDVYVQQELRKAAKAARKVG